MSAANSSSMYSASARLSTFVGFFFSCLLSTLAVIAASNFILYRRLTPSNINFEVKKLSLYRGIEDPYMNKPATLADMRFDLQIDFSPIFHWNTKQVYLYLVLEYTTPTHHRNEMIIWDKIIQSPQITGYKDGGKFTTRNARNKYPITDVSDQLYGTDAVISIRWNTVSHVGLLRDTVHGQYKTAFPTSIPPK